MLVLDGTDAGRKHAVGPVYRAALQTRPGEPPDILILPSGATLGGMLGQGGRLLFERLLAGKLDARDIAAVTSMSRFRSMQTS